MADVLGAIVREYIETAEPVASRTVSRRRREELSAASIRNVMADLVEEGYLTQPHTSAGRVPTEKAFRYFVQELSVRQPSAAELQRLQAAFSGVESMEEGIERSSRVLMDLTRNVGIAAAIPPSSQTLNQIQLLPLAERRVLVIVITSDRVVRNRVVTLDQEATPDELLSIRNYLNQNFAGWTISEIRLELERRLQLQGAYYDALLKRLSMLFARGLLDVDLGPAVHMDGASYLIALDLHLTREKMRELLQALEEKKRILQLLDRFLEEPSGEVQVQVGLGDLHPAMKELSLIGVNVASARGMAARVAVLGPMRMHYEKVMSVVFGVARTLQNLPS
ncbi:MAG TPA: heat-inducible transcriptional repressor HrcA [Bryobacteraceae bacterium]|nr:heat-inducible transcriptional repressor HrcA [Bryobacteraceae bacterium]